MKQRKSNLKSAARESTVIKINKIVNCHAVWINPEYRDEYYLYDSNTIETVMYKELSSVKVNIS